MTGARNPLMWLGAGMLQLVAAAAALFLLLRAESRPPVETSPAMKTADAPPMASSPAAGIRSRPEAAQLAAAFDAAFAGRDRRTVGENEYRYRPGGIVWIGERAVMVSPGTNLQDCHSCAGTLAVHYLEPVEDGFRVDGQWLEGGSFDDRGQPPQWHFSNELGQPTLRTEGGGGNQGVFCSSLSFFEFGADGPREIARVPTGFSDVGARVPEEHEPPTEVEGVIGNIVPGRSFDMAYTVRYFALRGGEFVPARNERVVERYVLRGGRYVPSSGESRVPPC